MRGSEREREILIRSNRLEEFRQKDDDLANRIHECGETRFLELCFVGWDHYANLDGILCELFHDFCNFFQAYSKTFNLIARLSSLLIQFSMRRPLATTTGGGILRVPSVIYHQALTDSLPAW